MPFGRFCRGSTSRSVRESTERDAFLAVRMKHDTRTYMRRCERQRRLVEGVTYSTTIVAFVISSFSVVRPLGVPHFSSWPSTFVPALTRPNTVWRWSR